MIVDLDAARSQVGRTGTEDDERIGRLLDAAVGIVTNHLKVAADIYDDSNGDHEPPDVIGQAMLLVVENLYLEPNADPLSAAVRSILLPLRDPALA